MKLLICASLIALLAGCCFADLSWRRHGYYNDDYDFDNNYGYGRHGYMNRHSYYPSMYRNYYSGYYRPYNMYNMYNRDWDDDYYNYGNYGRYGYLGNYGRHGYMSHYRPMRYLPRHYNSYSRY